MSEVAPVVYVTDLRFDRSSGFDAADLVDLAYLLHSPQHDVRAVCLTEADDSASRILAELFARTNTAPAIFTGLDSVCTALRHVDTAINLVVVGGYEMAASALEFDRDLFRDRAARCFVVGGVANDYARGKDGERIPIDPRLRDRNPERFSAAGDPRIHDKPSWRRLLLSGEGIIWLPRDISLWRYAASQVLDEGDPLCDFLLREAAASIAPLDDASDAPLLLSSLPALLLAVEPDPFAWMRLFRATPARVDMDMAGNVTEITMPTDRPNLYLIVAIDGQALSRLLTAGLRDRPLAG